MSMNSGGRVAKRASVADRASTAERASAVEHAASAEHVAAAERGSATNAPADAAERYGPIVVERHVKHDGRVLLLYSRAAQERS